MSFGNRTSGPINAIYIDRNMEHYGVAVAIMGKIMELGGNGELDI